MTCIFSQTYYLLFRYVHGHSIVARVTSNSCKICLQVFRVTVQAVQAAAVFLPPLLIMVSKSMFCLGLWCRGAPHCFTSTNPPPGCRSSRLLSVGLYKFVTRLWSRGRHQKILRHRLQAWAVASCSRGPVLCSRVFKIRAIHDIPSCQ